MPERRNYHHGDLRRVLLAATVEMIRENGPERLSLRELARRAGVSHAAPAHHFGDRAGLLTAVAVQGHDVLAGELESSDNRGGDLRELGVRYVRFTVEHPGHFAVMFRPDLVRSNDAELTVARARTAASLRTAAMAIGSTATFRPAPHDGSNGEDQATTLAAWSLAHGFAVLLGSGALDPIVGARDPGEVFRATIAAVSLRPLRGGR